MSESGVRAWMCLAVFGSCLIVVAIICVESLLAYWRFCVCLDVRRA